MAIATTSWVRRGVSAMYAARLEAPARGFPSSPSALLLSSWGCWLWTTVSACADNVCVIQEKMRHRVRHAFKMAADVGSEGLEFILVIRGVEGGGRLTKMHAAASRSRLRSSFVRFALVCRSRLFGCFCCLWRLLSFGCSVLRAVVSFQPARARFWALRVTGIGSNNILGKDSSTTCQPKSKTIYVGDPEKTSDFIRRAVRWSRTMAGNIGSKQWNCRPT